ncbi:sugar phosphate isomerase/epimerase family protein [Epibacterium ulvae]|uniref:Sugar phosphate isomerase/epimerase n=1 Tax=Epibacterium ulvae TaxID=1156985 RepID=A0A1G5QGR7_9RHOB|nr:sugar phosphate isomerase/epimerase [Epibacterium ulvae]SCZ60521.1 Sugar phosphate isomerase/epimerase [Epibacterium ulvae]
MSFSIQLYSLRAVPDQLALLQQLAEMGITQVEGYGGVFAEPESYRRAMDAAGITMPTAHLGVQLFEGGVESVVALTQTLGIKKAFAPYLDEAERPTTKEGYAAFAGKLVACAQALAPYGVIYGWHNHDFEFVPLADGSIPMEVMLEAEPSLHWEVDLGWLLRSGADPVLWLNRYAGQIQAFHIKDIAAEGENLDEDGWADLGAGTLDWAALIATCQRLCPDADLVLEHDNPSDPIRYAVTSAAALSSILGGDHG